MEIYQLLANNLQEVTCKIDNDLSYGIAGLSGSGKSTFCSTVADESIKRVVTLLPKSEYRFLFSDKLNSNFSAQDISDMPLVFYLGKSGFASNPRSTVGTHTGVFKEIRNCFAEKFDKTSDFFLLILLLCGVLNVKVAVHRLAKNVVIVEAQDILKK